MKNKWTRNASSVKGNFVSDKTVISMIIDEAKDTTRRSLAQFKTNFSTTFILPKCDPEIIGEMFNFDDKNDGLLAINPS